MNNMKTHWKTQFNYEYLGAYSLTDGKDIVLTIDRVTKEEITGANGEKTECMICYFKEAAKPMVMNKTNCKTLEKLHSPFVEDWPGKQIQIGAARVNAFGDKVDALRVRPFPPKKQSKPTVQTNSVQWIGIVQAKEQGYTLAQIQSKYELTQEQIKLLSV